MAFFDDWDWGKIAQGFAGALPGAVTGYLGARQVAGANTQAAEIAQRNAEANAARMQRASAPAMQYLQTVMAHNPNELTPQQDIQLGDARRRMVSATPTGLRGSGRYLAAAVSDVENRGRAGMIDTNTRRADTSAISQGNIATNTANAVSREATTGAEAGANAITNTAASNAKTLGDITSYFANSLKDSDRESRYGRAKQDWGNY